MFEQEIMTYETPSIEELSLFSGAVNGLEGGGSITTETDEDGVEGQED